MSREIIVPQLGEGLREVLLVKFCKQPGEQVVQGDILCQVETEKAVTEIEAPCDGMLEMWKTSEGAVVPVGESIGRLQTAESADESTVPVETATVTVETKVLASDASSTANRSMSPRTRSLIQKHDLWNEIERIPRSGPKLTPDEVQAYLDQRGSQSTTAPAEGAYSALQRREAFRFVQGARNCVPATLTARVVWDRIESQLSQQDFSVSDANRWTTVVLAWCIERAMRDHPLLRSRILPDQQRVVLPEPRIGIAVRTEANEFAVAVLQVDATSTFQNFFDLASGSIESVMQGKESPQQDAQVVLSNMMPFHIHDSVPTVVAPAVATIVVGDPFWVPRDDPSKPNARWNRVCNLSMTFDHRALGGIEASRFAHAVKGKLEQFVNPVATGKPNSDAPRAELPAKGKEEIIEELIDKLAELLGIAPSLVQSDACLADVGEDSLLSLDVRLVAERMCQFISTNHGREIDPDELISMTVEEMAVELG